MSARNAVKPIHDILRQDVDVDGDVQRLSSRCWMRSLKNSRVDFKRLDERKHVGELYEQSADALSDQLKAMLGVALLR